MKPLDECQKSLSRDAIKYIAMFTMLLNHIADIFLQTGTWLCEIFIAVGYFTAISMIYFLVEGYQYTHSKIFQMVFLYFLSHTFTYIGNDTHHNHVTPKYPYNSRKCGVIWASLFYLPEIVSTTDISRILFAGL